MSISLLDTWIAQAMADDHRRGATHGAGISSTGSVWCPECYCRFIEESASTATDASCSSGADATEPNTHALKGRET